MIRSVSAGTNQFSAIILSPNLSGDESQKRGDCPNVCGDGQKMSIARYLGIQVPWFCGQISTVQSSGMGLVASQFGIQGPFRHIGWDSEFFCTVGYISISVVLNSTERRNPLLALLSATGVPLLTAARDRKEQARQESFGQV
jgi:hypothetical protein